ncbi:MAG: hypothetical protein IPH37_16815 [Burkholderiales bacterium]|nr:hypothetical protein [Burkholderiales bacterium]
MIKVLNARPVGNFQLELDFSDHTHGVFDAAAYLATRSVRYWQATRCQLLCACFHSLMGHCVGSTGSNFPAKAAWFIRGAFRCVNASQPILHF